MARTHTTATRSHQRKHASTQHKARTSAEGVITSAVTAARELGAAAVSLKNSWDHVQNARRRGSRATSAVKRGAKKATRTITSAATSAAHTVLPGKQRTRRRK